MISWQAVRSAVRVGVASTFVVLANTSHATAALCVDVNLQFADRAPSGSLVESMKEEAASLWETYGLRIQWRGTTGAGRCASVQASFDVFVDRPRLRQATALKVTLGRTRVVLGAIDAVRIHIDQEAIERVLGSLTPDALAHLVGHFFAAPSDIGRALGRVLAHEIGHVILAARVHQAGGLMRAEFLAGDLIAHERHSYSLSNAELTRLHDREGELITQSSARHPDLSTSDGPSQAILGDCWCGAPSCCINDGGERGTNR